MKNLIVFVTSITLSIMCFAQLQNGSFEAWDSVKIDMPNGWFNSNMDAIGNGGLTTISKYTPAHGGNFSIKIETKANSTDTFAAYFFNARDMDQLTGGVPYSMQPDSFFCYAKLGVQPGDSAMLMIIFKNGGSPIGMNLFKISVNNPNVWQKLSFKLGILPMAPDTLIIAAASSNLDTETGIQPGSFVIFDDMSFNTSQPIPEGDFENWSSIRSEHPSTYIDANTSWVYNGIIPPVLKTTDAYRGNFAARIKTQSVGSNQIFCGMNNGNWDRVKEEYTGGFGYHLQVDTLIGWYKYTPKISGHNAALNINFQIADTTFQRMGTTLQEASAYTLFQIPFNLSITPDTAILTINSSQTPVNLEDTGSVLIIDDIQFKSAMINTGVQTFSSGMNIIVAPNPNNGEFSFLCTMKNSCAATYTIFDTMGKAVKSDRLRSMKTNIDLTSNPKGIYLLKITGEGNTVSKKIIIR